MSNPNLHPSEACFVTAACDCRESATIDCDLSNRTRHAYSIACVCHRRIRSKAYLLDKLSMRNMAVVAFPYEAVMDCLELS
jgi:hypothetical protein